MPEPRPVRLEEVRAAIDLASFDDAAAREIMAARPRPSRPARPWRDGAVLILLYPGEAGLTVVLTRRTETVEHHRGQISFPGGAREDGERLEAAALREAVEEVGVREEDVTILGRLARLEIPPSGFVVHPFVGYVDRRPEFRPDPREVADVLEVPLSHLLDESRREEEVREIRGEPVRVPFYRVPGVGRPPLWGATAMMLSGLVERLRRVRE